jgi:hypothetical protein
MLIATSRYHARDVILASPLAPVRVAVGAPRFPFGFDLAGACSMLVPYGAFGRNLSHDEFESAYRTRLDRFGVDAIRSQLERLAVDAPGVVLLCFEDVHAGQSCHRRVFAQWWQERTGEEVPEL